MVQPPNEITIPLSEAVSDALDRPVTELPPLANAIDPAGLDTIVSGHPSHDVTISFTYADLHVIVRSDTNSETTVYVSPLQETHPDWNPSKR